MELWQWLVIGAMGPLVGFVNVMAGGGSLMTLPVLILMGLPPVVANGTNRVALLLQNGSSVVGFYRQGFSSLRESAILAAMSLPGAIIGAYFSTKFDPNWFKRVLVIVMIGALVITLLPQKKEEDRAKKPAKVWLARLSMFAIGFYGGFIQAGVGLLIIPLLRHFLRLDLVRVNMHKVFIIGAYTLPALIVFIIAGDVRWMVGLLLAVGSSLGAWISVKVQIKKGAGIVKVIYSFAIVAIAVKLLWSTL